MASLRLGGKLRRLRQELKLSQTQMAARLDISPSYLNLLEHNQRALTVPLLLKLAQTFDIEVAAFTRDDDERLIRELTEAFADPVFDGHDLKTTDLTGMVAQSPQLARAVLDLYRAWRNRADAPARDIRADPDEPTAPPIGIPVEEVADFIQARGNYFRDLEQAAEQLWDEAALSLDGLPRKLAEHLASRYAVDVLTQPELPGGALRQYDPRTRRLALAEALTPAGRAFQMAHQVAMLAHRPVIERLAANGKLTSAEADQLARISLANYFAAAVMMPYDAFLEAARRGRYDIERLMRRFGTSFEQCSQRLTTLSRPGDKGIPFHFLRLDLAGNIAKRFSGSGIPIARFGGACPRWNVHAAFTQPGQIRTQVSRLPDGSTWFCIARTVKRPGQLGQVERSACGIGCGIEHAREIAYADGLDLGAAARVVEIGVACRVCPRAQCADRAEPAPGFLGGLDLDWRGASPLAGPGPGGK